jgi:hypothetical protein
MRDSVLLSSLHPLHMPECKQTTLLTILDFRKAYLRFGWDMREKGLPALLIRIRLGLFSV